MPPDAQRSERILDPIARVSEILFGLIMALTFTSAIGAATAGRDEVRTLLVAAILCNVAWGLVDAVMFLMSSLAEHGHALLTVRAVHDAARPEDAYRVISGAIPPVLASILSTDDFEKVRQGLLRMTDLPAKPTLTREDWLGALAVFLLVVLSTFPIVIPFLVFDAVQPALRVSNLIALAMMFVAGFWLARHGGHHPWIAGVTVTLLGIGLVAIANALGG